MFDPGNLMNGYVGTRGGSNRSGGQGVKIWNQDQPPGPVSAPSAPPASASAWTNNYVRDVFVSLSATTITAVTVTGQNGVAKALSGLAGSPAFFNFEVPANSTYTPTYTGAAAHVIVVK